MYLICTDTLKLVRFNENDTPPYAILSHTWGSGEVSFQDIYDKDPEDHPRLKTGYSKILGTCRTARQHRIHYAWVDTCCIDKTSSAELSESINSMFRWYQKAAVCYVLLSDVKLSKWLFDGVGELGKSRWFYRGWTLQELLAPTRLEFYSGAWGFLSGREMLAPAISEITGIAASYLQEGSDIRLLLRTASVAERMSWAAKRETTRTEDIAYCLLGIFDINMPLLYGEGEKAFLRLQEEIIRRWDDQSLLAWHYHSRQDKSKPWGVLASSPANFANCGQVIQCRVGSASTMFSTTNKGLHITLPMCHDHALLECSFRNDPTIMTVLRLKKLYGNVYIRAPGERTGAADYRAWRQWKRRPITILTREELPEDGGGFTLVVRNLCSESSIAAVVDSRTVRAGTDASIVIPMVSSVAGEFNIEWTPDSSEPRIVVLKLTAQKLDEPESTTRWALKTEFLPEKSSSLGVTHYRCRGRFQSSRYGTKFFALPVGDLLYAEMGSRDVPGQTIWTVVLRRASSWSLKGIHLRTAGLLLDWMPELLSSALWSFYREAFAHGLIESLLILLKIPKVFTFIQQITGSRTSWETIWKILGGFGVRIPQIRPSVLIASLLRSTLKVLSLERRNRIVGSTIRKKHRPEIHRYSFLFDTFCAFFPLTGPCIKADLLLYLFLPSIFRSLWILYKSLRLLWTARPQYVGEDRRVRYPVRILPRGSISEFISSWILAWMSWRHLSRAHS